MNYIEMTKYCELCHKNNDDVTCKECISFNRCLIIEDKKMTKINVEKEYYHVKTKIIQEIFCIDNDVIYIRKIGKTNYKVQSLNRKHPIIQMALIDFEQTFSIY